MSKRDYYSILGVDSKADSRKIREAFRTRVREVHPDRNPDDPLAHKKTVEIIEAYKVIGNEKRRRTYDLSIKLNKLSSQIQIEQCPVTRDVTYINPRLIRILATFMLFISVFISVFYMKKDKELVFRPMLSIIETNPSTTVAHLITPSIYDCLDYYFTSRYSTSAGDYQSSMFLVSDYFELAENAKASGNKEKAEYYINQMNNYFNDLKELYIYRLKCKNGTMP